MDHRRKPHARKVSVWVTHSTGTSTLATQINEHITPAQKARKQKVYRNAKVKEGEETIDLVLACGAKLHPSPMFGRTARALVLQIEDVKNLLPLGYLLAIGQISRWLCEMDHRRKPHARKVSVWVTHSTGTSTLATQINEHITPAQKARKQKVYRNAGLLN